MKVIHALGKWFSHHVLIEFPEYAKAQKICKKEVEDSESSYDDEREKLRCELGPNLDGDTIQRHQQSAAQRLRSIEDKARANLLGITIGIAVLFSGLNLVAGEGADALVPGWLRVPFLLLFVVAVVYLLTGGLMALKALHIMRVFVSNVREEATDDEHTRAVRAVWVLGQNERVARMRTNALSVSFGGIRNGIICLALVVMTVICIAVNSDSAASKPDYCPVPSACLDSVQPAVSAPNQEYPTASS